MNTEDQIGNLLINYRTSIGYSIWKRNRRIGRTYFYITYGDAEDLAKLVKKNNLAAQLQFTKSVDGTREFLSTSDIKFLVKKYVQKYNLFKPEYNKE